MDVTPVTNAQFAKFIAETIYITIAERKPKAEDYPNAPPENLVAGSVCFSPPDRAVRLDNHFQWWGYVKGADWKHPNGPQSDLKDRENHPVVHISYDDALAYCKWAGKRLPTEAEFEFAARGGLDRKKIAWGDELQPGGKWVTNIWQGNFPNNNTCLDGYSAIAPVGSFPANGFGLRDISGNVWQWCSDWYRHDYYQTVANQPQPVRNPQGPADSLDPAERGVAKRVQRGGSYLCTDQYCTWRTDSHQWAEPQIRGHRLALLLVLLLPLPLDVELRLLAAVLHRAFPFELVPINRELVLDGELVLSQLADGREAQLSILQFQVLKYPFLLVRPAHRAGELVPILLDRQGARPLQLADRVLALPRPHRVHLLVRRPHCAPRACQAAQPQDQRHREHHLHVCLQKSVGGKPSDADRLQPLASILTELHCPNFIALAAVARVQLCSPLDP
jgi:formylglycine-generating enzyme required for sulfatase activity